ncbi:hypothetical protein [Pseudomonas nunensis]|uniref:Delta-60 repeat domain-containing protein n=1 Tax=Pseudomonas nunensis TaxID=2961896 RepID=A0ABY5ESY3_9PSED|nr:hypothetical protein [Pseudomonas nunensis]KPN91107.1 hypothetical protein AL066_12465 [Pseudomonas nunensis]MCL5227394.1 hypothetical protein [Pseudomonas nunensis]UTO17377.1 hypothetical protein NK667_13820 [Pseudomonas nunensis]
MNLQDEPSVTSRAPGDLDRTFGTNGTMDQFAVYSRPLTFFGQRPDGKALLVGTVRNDDGFFYQLAQLLPNGKLDESFGDEGLVVGTFKKGIGASGLGAQLLDDGRIILLGAHNDGERGDAVARFLADGTLDTSFGDGGVALIPPVFNAEHNAALQEQSEKSGTGPSTIIAVAPNGKIVIGRQRLLQQLDENGAADLSFNKTGHIILEYVTITAVKVSENGVITAAGSEIDAAAVLRFNSDGTPDTSFSDDGILRFRAEDTDTSLSALLLRPNGSFFVAGHIDRVRNDVWGVGRRCLLAAFNASGSPNLTFNNGQPLVSELAGAGSCVWADLGLDTDNHIIAVGSTGRRSEEISLVGRYELSGKLDASFGQGKGYVNSRIGIDRNLWESVLVLADKRILATGVCRLRFEEAVVACYLG